MKGSKGMVIEVGGIFDLDCHGVLWCGEWIEMEVQKENGVERFRGLALCQLFAPPRCLQVNDFSGDSLTFGL